MRSLPAILLVVFSFLAPVACHQKHRKPRTPVNPAPDLVSIVVTPADLSVPLGAAVDYTATGSFSDGSSRDITSTASWSTSNPFVASIQDEGEEKGRANSLSMGQTTITATQEGISGSTTLTVTAPVIFAIEVTPPNPTIVVGTKQQFLATGILSDLSRRDVTQESSWSSSDTTVATVENAGDSKGRAMGMIPGKSTIKAALDSIEGTAMLTVVPATLLAIEVTPTNPTIIVGTNQQFTATGRFDNDATQDITQQVTWSATEGAVATIIAQGVQGGLATGRAVGSTPIRAQLGDVVGETTLTVRERMLLSIEVTPTNPSILVNTTQKFMATGRFEGDVTQDLTLDVAWTSSDTAVATIEDQGAAKGTATGLSAGKTTIRATLGAVSGSTELTVTAITLVAIIVRPANPTIMLGTSQAFTAEGVFSNDTRQDVTQDVTWSSTDTAVATISNAAGSKGVATSASVGQTTIRATLNNVTGETSLTVRAIGLVSIEVAPPAASIKPASAQPFTATGRFEDDSTQDITKDVTWSSSLDAVATISNAAGSKGVATGVAPGQTTITAARDGKSGTATLTVVAVALVSLDVTPKNPTIDTGGTQPFTATGRFENDATQNLTQEVTWTSTETAVAAISNAAGSKGVATGVSGGTTAIRASLDGIQGETTLTVRPPAPRFRRCEANQDDKFDIADGVWIMNDLFRGDAPPTLCIKAADCNDDGNMDLSDAIYMFSYQYEGGPAPPAPFPACGVDPTGDELSCESFEACR